MEGYKTYALSWLGMILSTAGVITHQIPFQQDLFNILIFSVAMALRSALKTERGKVVGGVVEEVLKQANQPVQPLTEDQINRGIEAFRNAISEVPPAPEVKQISE